MVAVTATLPDVAASLRGDVVGDDGAALAPSLAHLRRWHQTIRLSTQLWAADGDGHSAQE